MLEKRVEFYNTKSQKIVGLLSLPKNKKPPIVIIIHGFKGAKEYHPFANNSVKPLVDAGIGVLRIDCRGSGESDLEFKDMTIKSESEDVLTALKYVKTLDIDAARISLIGISMGVSAILLAMKKRSKIKAFVFWSPAWRFVIGSSFDTPENRKQVKEQGGFWVTQGLTGKRSLSRGS